jgi:hypothetical protein
LLPGAVEMPKAEPTHQEIIAKQLEQRRSPRYVEMAEGSWD